MIPGLDLAVLTTVGYALVLLAGAYGLGRCGERSQARFGDARSVPWPHRDAARFYWSLALLLVVLAVVVTIGVLGRRREPIDVAAMVVVAALAGRAARWLVTALRAAK